MALAIARIWSALSSGYVPMWYTLEMSDCVLRVPYPDRNVRAWGLMRGTNCAEFIDVVDKELEEPSRLKQDSE